MPLCAFLHGAQCALRNSVPGELRRAPQAMGLQVASKRSIGQHGLDLRGQRIDIRRIEERIGPSNDFRNARRVGAHHRGAARHRFQRGQPEAFLERREARHRAVAVERGEIRVGQPSRKQHVGGVQSLAPAQCAKAPALVAIHGADEDELISRAKGQRKPGIRSDQVRNVFPRIETAGMEEERSRDSVTCAKRGNGVGRQRPGSKDIACARGNDDHALGLHRQARDRLRTRVFGHGEQEVRALQRCKLSLVPVDARRGRQALAARQRDKVVERRCRRVQRVDRSHGRNGVVDQPFEQACYVHDVRTQSVEKGLADRLGDTASPPVGRVERRRRRRRREHGDTFLADEIGERVAQRPDRLLERSVERDPDLVRAWRGGDRRAISNE